MATTGEIIWAQLIASKPAFRDFSRASMNMCLFVVTGHGRRVEIVRSCPLRDFYLRSFTFLFRGSPQRLRVRLGFEHFPIGSLAKSTYVADLQWTYRLFRTQSGWGCRFTYGPHVRVSSLVRSNLGDTRSPYVWRSFRFYAPYGWQASPGSAPKGSWTPQKMLNLALSSTALLRVLNPKRGYRMKGPKQPSTPPPNPVTRNTPWILATESPAQAYSQQWVNPGYESFFRSHSSVNTPGYKTKKKSELPVNPYSLTLRKTYDGPGYAATKVAPATSFSSTWGKTSNQSLFIGQPGPPSDLWSSMVRDRAIQRLIASVKDGASSNLALNIAQANLVGNMLANTARRITGSVRSLRKGDFLSARNYLLDGRRAPPPNQIRKGNPSVSKSLANNWLELQYGWKPLLSDLDGALQLLAQYNYGAKSWQVARGSAKMENTDKRTLAYNPHGIPIPVGVYADTWRWGHKVGVRYRVANSNLSFLAQTGFTNPINLVWELIPWSFVVDWFIPIGPWLESLDGFSGLEFDKGYEVSFKRRVTTAEVNADGKSTTANPHVDYRFRGSYWRDQVQLDRIPLLGFPSLSLPSFNPRITALRAANALALIRQAFR